jgi:hypothetical protein
MFKYNSGDKFNFKNLFFNFQGSTIFSFQTQFLQFPSKIQSKINIFHTLALKIVK